MWQLNSKTSSIIIICLLSLGLLYKVAHPSIEYKEKVVTKIQERVRTLTKIKVSPDGTKETTIDELSETDTLISKETTSRPVNKNDWLISVSATPKNLLTGRSDYGLGIQKRVILDAYVGLDYRAGNKLDEIRAVITYSF